MNKTIIIVSIAVLAVVAICLGVYISLIPDPVEPVYVDPHTPNSLIDTLGITRPDKKVERLIAIKTYQDGMDFKDILDIAQIGGLEYVELEKECNDYLLIVPFEINGNLTVSKLVYNDYEETYEKGEIVHSAYGGEPIYDNYSLLLKYSRPDVPGYQIELTQGEQTATYQILNKENGNPVKKLQFIKDNIDKGTESFGEEIKIVTVKE